MEDYKRSKGATTDENDERVHILVMRDKRRSLPDIARQMGISFGAV